mmetsp:Transcript_29041/g.53444  ORF Transcript_29041/g.53444 Transcript_29041/m.53444 type:complete len:859 (+) Transcript_29041:90-2666(+)
MQVVALPLFCVTCMGFGWRTRPQVQSDPCEVEMRLLPAATPKTAFASFSPEWRSHARTSAHSAPGLATSGPSRVPSVSMFSARVQSLLHRSFQREEPVMSRKAFRLGLYERFEARAKRKAAEEAQKAVERNAAEEWWRDVAAKKKAGQERLVAKAVKQQTSKSTEDQGAEGIDAGGLSNLRAELMPLLGGPSNSPAQGNKERKDWFKSWLDNLEELHPKDVSRDQLLELAERDPELLAMARAHGIVCHDALRTVRVAAESELRPALEAHAALEWAEGLSAMCGQLGKVVCIDPSDKTSQVQFHSPINVSVWLPSSVLRDEDVDEAPHTVHQERPARSSPQQRRFRFKTSRLTKKVKQVFIRSEKLRSRQGAAAKEFEARASAKEAGAKAAAEAEKDPLREALEPAQKAVEEKAAEIRNLRAKPNELEAVNAAAEAKAAAEAQARAAEANAATLILVEKREALKEQYRALEEKVAARLQAAEEKFVFAENMMSEINVKQTKLSMEADALEEERARCAKAKEFAQADLAAKQEAVQKTQRAAEEKLAAAENMMSEVKAEQTKLSMEAEALQEEKAMDAKAKTVAEANLAAEQEAVQKIKKAAEEKLTAAENIMSETKAMQAKLSMEAKALEEERAMCARARAAAEEAQKVAEEKLAAAEETESKETTLSKKAAAEAEAIAEETAELMSKARRFLRSHFPLLPTSIFAEDVQVEMKGAEEQSSGDRLASALRDLLVAWARRAEAQISFERLAGPLERVDANYWYLQALCRIQVRGKQGPTDVQAHMTLRLNDNWQIFFVGIQKFIVNDEQLLAVEDVEALQRLWCTQSRQISLRTTSRSSPPARRMSGSRWNRLRSNAVVR